ncbi:DUF1016 family protein [Luteolibacter yonseiensis]|uniref:DUF1016 family protein n=1 Tax=Luteolibacter yonseiensis TaxID=1144680 RepID=A0A934R5H5_9BACT|nr:PDDEXK nuclease domain-containing protein [Luteolibacter yonseiensis]MBK1815620.1 DUF1016 family protein [Luteolibacter yonseiensis]
MKKRPAKESAHSGDYSGLVGNIGELLDSARRSSARAVNAVMTATYWEIGRNIVEFEQQGKERAEYGERLPANLSTDLTTRYGRGFGLVQVRIMRQFFLTYPMAPQASGSPAPIRQSSIDEFPSTLPPSIRQSLIGESRQSCDIGQMHLYLNYAREHWCEENENPPIGLILCTEKGESLARYALEGLPNKTLVREYRTVLPDEQRLADEIQNAWHKLSNRG